MAQAGPNPVAGLGPAPKVSMTTMHMCGLLVDVYGLEELRPSMTHVSCLWLHHGRLESKEQMADIAARCVAGWHEHVARSTKSAGSTSSIGEEGPTVQLQQRGLIALAVDARNHGTRMVHKTANEGWPENETHAQDMFYIISGNAADQSLLLDAVGAYLFVDGEAATHSSGPRRQIEQHLILGFSLGGHLVWQTLFGDHRITAGIAIVGCPDYIRLMTDRARLKKLPTYKADDQGASFLGSRHFPTALVKSCEKSDPKARIFGTEAFRQHAESSEQKHHLNHKLSLASGKKFLACFGADDKMVPYRASKWWLDWFNSGVRSGEFVSRIWMEEIIYPNTGHVFSAEMTKRSVDFVCEVLDGQLDNQLRAGNVVVTSSDGGKSLFKI